jgi:transcriptional regulator with XRE-family HTH domain
MKVQESEQIQKQIDEIIQKCVHLRKKDNCTILQLSKILELDRRQISDFEKGKFNIFLADNILSYFGYDLIIWSSNERF